MEVASKLSTGLEKREEGHCGEIDGCDVGVENFLPVLEGLGLPELLLKLASFGGVWRGFGTTDTCIGDYTPISMYPEMIPGKY